MSLIKLKYLVVIILAICTGCSVYATDRPWAAIEKVNKTVNNKIEYWDNPNDWQLPINGKGDCTTYAMVKQLRLAAIGIDSQLYSCRINNKGHAVLLIDNYVLDNEYKSIWHKDKLEYKNYILKELR